MPDPSHHPPKPVLSYRLGIAGTRELGNADPGLAHRIGTFLDFLKERVYAIWREQPEYFAADEPQLILISSLAMGVDLLVAKLARERGYKIHVPLAFPRNTYARLNFTAKHVKERKHFEELLLHAEAVLELDGDPEAETNAYNAASSVLVHHSDTLLAIWDFGPGNGDGGTKSSVDKAQAAGIPVVRVRPDQPHAPAYYVRGEDHAYEELKPVIRRQLLSGIVFPESKSIPDRHEVKLLRKEQKRLAAYYAEQERRIDLSWPYKIAGTILAMQLPKRASKLTFDERAVEAWRPTGDETSRDPAREHFQKFDAWADGLAVFYAGWMRSTVVIIAFFGAIVLAYALALKLWPCLGKVLVLPAIEGISMLVLTVMALVGIGRDIHARWLQYRMLSEFLRSAGLASAIGGLPLAHSRLREADTVSRSWVAFYFQAVVRSMGLPNVAMNGNYLADFKELLITRLANQIEFHKGRQSLFQIIDRNSRFAGVLIFLVSLAGALLQIGSVFLRGPTGRIIPPAWQPNLSNTALVLPILGGALAAFVAQESFGRLSHLSGTVARRLENVVDRVKDSPAESARLREATSAAIDEMMAEHEEWFMLYSLRDIELP